MDKNNDQEKMYQGSLKDLPNGIYNAQIKGYRLVKKDGLLSFVAHVVFSGNRVKGETFQILDQIQFNDESNIISQCVK